MKTTLNLGFLVVLMLGLAAGARADNTTCDGAIFVIPDGSTHEGTLLDSNDQRWFTFLARANRSYVITVDNLAPADENRLVGLSTFVPTPTCAFLMETFGTLIGQTAPFSDFNGVGIGSTRWSLERATDTTIAIRLTMSSVPAVTGDFRIRVEETTLYNPAWSTFGTFETFYSCTNTTNSSSLDVTLRLFNTAGAQVATFSFADIPAGGTVSTNTELLGVANNLNGSATATHNGPPGAFLCEAAIANLATAPNVIMQVKFTRSRQQR